MNTLLLIGIYTMISIIALLIMMFLLYKYLLPKMNEHFTTEKPPYADVPTYDIQEIPHFFTDEECDALIERAQNNLEDSKIYNGNDNDMVTKNDRDSKQAWLYDSDDFVKKMSDKIKDYTSTHNRYTEEFQVVNYKEGGFFRPHYDACDGDGNYCRKMDGDNGARYLTVLIYLNNVEEGGETIFPNINKSVKPEKGKMVIFQNVDDSGHIITQSYHGGEPVKKGEKWICNKWIHLKQK